MEQPHTSKPPGFCVLVDLGPERFQLGSRYRQSPPLGADHLVSTMNVGQVLGANHVPGMGDGVEKERPFKEFHSIQDELICRPGLVLLRMRDGVEEIAATAQNVSSLGINP